MIENIIQMALESGIWAGLFCFLFLYQLKNSAIREEKYTQTVAKLADGIKSIALIEDDTDMLRTDTDRIKDDIDTIKDDVVVIKSDVQSIKSDAVKIRENMFELLLSIKEGLR